MKLCAVYGNIIIYPKTIFYLLKGDYRPKQTEFPLHSSSSVSALLGRML